MSDITWKRITTTSSTATTKQSNMATSNYEEREYHKVPEFTGLKKDWMIWSEKFITVLERRGMPVLIEQLLTTEEVPKDADECKETTSPHAVIEARLDYKRQNAKAFAYLFESIDDKTVPGKECWLRIKGNRTDDYRNCLLYKSPTPRDKGKSVMLSSARKKKTKKIQ